MSGTMRMPAIFFGHGNPMNALYDNDYTRGWAALGKSLPRPKAVLCISAHWYMQSRTFDSAIAKIGEQYSITGPISEYRAVLRSAVAELYKKIDQAIARTRDVDTLLHLRLLRGQLAEVP